MCLISIFVSFCPRSSPPEQQWRRTMNTKFQMEWAAVPNVIHSPRGTQSCLWQVLRYLCHLSHDRPRLHIRYINSVLLTSRKLTLILSSPCLFRVACLITSSCVSCRRQHYHRARRHFHGTYLPSQSLHINHHTDFELHPTSFYQTMSNRLRMMATRLPRR